MPFITTYSDDYSFKGEYKDEKGKATKTAYYYLQHGIHVQTEVGSSSQSYWAIREDPRFGLCWWDRERFCWKPYQEDIQKMYSDHKAEKILLTDEE